MRGTGRIFRGAACRVRTVVATLGLLVVLLLPVAASAQSFNFSTIRVEGNERVDATTVASFANIPRGQTISQGDLNAAFQRVVNAGLFEDVVFDPRGNTLVITVREFPTINVISIEGNRRIDDEVLLEVIESQARRVYSPAAAERDAAAIAEVYRARGRFAAEVTPRIIDRSGNRVDLVFEVREGRTVEVERLAFVGNRAFSDQRLRRVLDTKQAGLLRRFVQRDTFLEERIELDRQLLRDFYLARGYIDFQILSVTSELSREQDAFFITFTIREGQPYRIGNVTTVSEIDGVSAEDFRNEVRVRSGQTFSPNSIDATVARMERLASQRGLRFARVDPRITRNERAGTVDIEFALVPGERIFVERIDIQGNVTTLDRVIRRQFRIAEGDPLNPREIREAAERIRALGYFADVEVEGRSGSADDQVVIDVNVEETTTGSLGFGISYARGEGFGGTISFSELNFLGRGQEVDFALNTTRGSREFTFGFVEPAFLERDLRLGLSLGYRETRSFRGSDFDTRTIRISPSLGFPLTENSRLSVRYTLQDDKLRRVGDDVSAIIRDEPRRATTSLVGYTWTYNALRSELNPGTGYFFRFSQDFAGVGGDRRFIRTTALGLVEQRVLNEEVTLRVEVEGGALNMLRGDSRFVERFELSDAIRGFRPGRVGPRDRVSGDNLRGNYLAAARFEADFPLGLPEEYGLSGGVFFDVGSAWKLDNVDGGPFGDDPVDDSLRWRAAAGVSLFWDTPLGPLRFNFSRPVRKTSYDRAQNFDFSISSRF